jgi:uncharacterized paraquat-inducible protein A
MALIKCPECKAQVSNQAASCPKCGFELKQQGAADQVASSFVMLLKVILGGVAVLLGGFLLFLWWFATHAK